MESSVLPFEIFDAGDEPVGIRVTPYYKPGEFVDQAPFYGRLRRYILSRQLKVRKKYEAWFLFAETPIRFALREFTIVTGLPCSKYLNTLAKDMKNLINEQPFYNSLFGMIKEVSVASVIRMLKRKTVTTTEIRIKYALVTMLVPTTHVDKISVEHAERIRNLDEFFSFMWGHVFFQMLISSIKERDEISLSQSTIVVAGYVHALQMVLTKAVHSLIDIVRQDSATEGGGVEDDVLSPTSPRNGIKPAHARTLDTAKNVRVTSIIPPENLEVDEAVLCFSDKEDDDSVDKMVTLIKEGTHFTKEMFKGRATKADVARMRDEANAIGKKKRKRKSTSKPSSGCDPDAEYTTLRGHMQEVLKKYISDNFAQLLALQNSYKVILNLIGTSQSVLNYPPREGNPTNNLRGDSSNSQLHANPTIHRRPADVSNIINSIVDNVKETHDDNIRKVECQFLLTCFTFMYIIFQSHSYQCRILTSVNHKPLFSHFEVVPPVEVKSSNALRSDGY
ncbi:hypothetical protein N665_0232s0025 [Sinapis alba]|nr:hypothetical protein N665_0232s0025 [Sinapis alba]